MSEPETKLKLLEVLIPIASKYDLSSPEKIIEKAEKLYEWLFKEELKKPPLGAGKRANKSNKPKPGRIPSD